MYRRVDLVSLVIACSVAGCNEPAEQQISKSAARVTENRVVTTASDRPSWPALFGPDRTNESDESGLQFTWGDQGPPIVWERPIGTGYSSPVVADGKVVVMHRLADREIVECMDASSGEPVWTYDYSSSFNCSVAYSSGPYSTPVIAEGVVYAYGAQGQLNALTLANGVLLWKRDLHKDYEIEDGLFPAGATPLLVDDKLILSLGGRQTDAGIIAVDAHTGDTVWTTTDHDASYATPFVATIHGRKTVFVVTFEGLIALDPISGHVHWDSPFRPKSPDSVNATSPLVLDDHVLMVTGPGPGAICLRVADDGTCELAWRDRRVLDSQFTGLLLHDDCVFGFTSKRQGGAELRCVDFRTGQIQWTFASDLGRGSLLAADGYIVVLGEDGHLASLELRTDRASMVSMTPEPILDAPCYASPALCNKRLFVRNEKRILCLDVVQKHRRYFDESVE
ncbi:MAG: PQQ-binding-like beta-propeller repeat protein [Planctomycetales bacterium]|nr:PQQ-binding-like beta-propeller repeat protein [Planctomycetales bacterium]